MEKSATTDLLNDLLKSNRLATRPWLLENGLSKDRLDNYVKSGRLRKLARGVYCHRYATLSWQSVAASFGESVPILAYVGGLTALQENGFSQYLNIAKTRTIALYSPASQPHWLNEVSGCLDGVSFRWYKIQRLWPPLSALEGFKGQPGLLHKSYNDANHSLRMASTERAFIELLELVPKAVSFEHADELMQGLANLSPRRLEALLGGCNSVKAKRLFCWFADRHQHAWWKRLDYQQFNLGQGKRVLQTGGRLDSRYQITVPSHMSHTYDMQGANSK